MDDANASRGFATLADVSVSGPRAFVLFFIQQF
jgi:hypothetical protein